LKNVLFISHRDLKPHRRYTLHFTPQYKTTSYWSDKSTV